MLKQQAASNKLQARHGPVLMFGLWLIACSLLFPRSGLLLIACCFLKESDEGPGRSRFGRS